MPYELLGKFRRMLIYALWRPKLRAIYRVARIFLGMISGLTKEMDASVVYAGTFLTVNGLKRAAFRLFGPGYPEASVRVLRTYPLNRAVCIITSKLALNFMAQ
jgi:hypothetical protein